MYTTWRQRLFRQIIFSHDLLWGAMIFSVGLSQQWGWSTWSQSAHITIPCVLLAQGIGWSIWRVQNASWRFFSWVDLEKMIKAIVIMQALLWGANQWLWPTHMRVLVALMSVTVLFQVLLGMRFVYRKIRMAKYNQNAQTKQRTLIIGADERAVNIIRACQSEQSAYQLVGLIDTEQPAGIGKEILGLRVLGDLNGWSMVAKEYRISTLIFSKKCPPAILAHMISTAKKAGWKTLIYPDNMEETLTSKPVLKQIRPIDVEDLLGRAPVKVAHFDLEQLIKDQVILVTGGGGSIGSELCRQLLCYQPKTLMVVDNNEYNLFTLQQELKDWPSLTTNVQYYLGSTNDEPFIRHIFSKQNIDLLFHAAAYKHVPLLENQVTEAMKNNVLSTIVIAEYAQRYGVKRCILVSTDKAVHPTNVMGATKRMCEQVWMQPHQTNTQFGLVRFGNVLGSRGSVIETFTKQLHAGGPLTVTDPKITRYFMTIPEAAQLIIQAAAFKDIEAIFVLDMGEPVEIKHLAQKMIELSGREDIHISYSGLRPGEKIFEELFYAEEALEKTKHPKIHMAKIHLTPCQLSTLKRTLQDPNEQYDDILMALLIQFAPSLAEHREKVNAPV